MISAEIIADSISPQGHRLTTFKLRYPKFIHCEFMTHRMVSRNASSSRAIPTKKLIEEVRSDALRAAPIFWGKNQKGMQAVEELSFPFKEDAQSLWANAALAAANIAEEMLIFETHKQIVNRLLEPFSHINVVATATEWDNFFGLRLHKDAQPEMRALAIAMWEARRVSTPQLLKPGQWHLPFCDPTDERDGYPIMAMCLRHGDDGDYDLEKAHQIELKVSVSRCARVSYESFETDECSTVEEDLELYDKLMGKQPLHASPAEHQATPDSLSHRYKFEHRAQWGNFRGWRQYRKMFPGESCAPLPEGYSA